MSGVEVEQLLRAAAVDYTAVSGKAGLGEPLTAVTADSRRAGPGALFVALPGTRVDGHAYVAAAVAAGCRAVLTGSQYRLPAAVTDPVLHLATADPRAALGRLCAAWQGFPAREMVLIGITGTNGKTTTAYLLEELVRRGGGVPGVIGTINYRYRDRVLPASHTTPEPESLQCLLREMADAGVSHVIMEVSSHALEQQRVAGIAFDVALFTNLSHDHLDYHGDMERYFAGKKLLFERYLKPGGAAVVLSGPPEQEGRSGQDWNRRLIADLLPRAVPASGTAGAGEHALRLFRCGADGIELRLVDYQADLAGVTARLAVGDTQWQLQSSLVGDFNLDNLLGVAGVGLALGHHPAAISAALATAGPPPGRLEPFGSRCRVRGEIEVLVDYAHTPAALGHVLAAVGRLAPGRLIVIFGCGGDRDRAKRPLMGEIAARLADIVVLTSDNPRSEDPLAILADIRRGLVKAGARRGRLENLLADRQPLGRRAAGRRPAAPEGRTCRGYDLIVSRRQAIRDTLFFAGAGDVVVICGKGHETTQIIGGRCLKFDDRQEVREQLAVLAPAG